MIARSARGIGIGGLPVRIRALSIIVESPGIEAAYKPRGSNR